MNRPDAAVESFNQSMKADPAYAKAYHMRGLAFESKGDHEAALNDFNKAIELNPHYGAAYHSRGTLYAKMGREDLSIDDIQSVAHLTNVNIETFANENNVWRSNQLRVEDMLESEWNKAGLELHRLQQQIGNDVRVLIGGQAADAYRQGVAFSNFRVFSSLPEFIGFISHPETAEATLVAAGGGSHQGGST